MPKLEKDIWPGSESLGVWRPSGLRGLDGSLLQKISLTSCPGKRYSGLLGAVLVAQVGRTENNSN